MHTTLVLVRLGCFCPQVGLFFSKLRDQGELSRAIERLLQSLEAQTAAAGFHNDRLSGRTARDLHGQFRRNHR